MNIYTPHISMPGSAPEQTYEYDPATSKFDFNGATLIDDPRLKSSPMGQYFTPSESKLVTYQMPDGAVVQYAPGTDTVTTYNPSLSTFKYAGNTYEGIPYAQPEIYSNGQAYELGPQDEKYWSTKFQGQDVLLNTGLNYEYDPVTGKAKDYGGGLGRDLRVIAPSKSGGFSDFMTENGWILPVAMATAGAGAAALGGGAAAAEGAGAAGSMDAYMASAGLNPGTYAAADFSPAYTGISDYMTQAGMNPGTFEGTGFQMPAGSSVKDALTYANRARQIGGLLNNVAGMGSSRGGTSGINPQQLASLLGGGSTPQTNSFIGQIKGNQNPFLFVAPNQTQATEGTYDVSGSNLANALRKK
jgi:hypothetical protein